MTNLEQLNERRRRRIWPLAEPAVIEAQRRLVLLVDAGSIGPAIAKIVWRDFIRALLNVTRPSMKRTATMLAIALALALPAAGQISHFASCNSPYTGGQNETSWSCSLNVPAGGLITVAFAANSASAPTMTVSDTKGDPFAMAGDIPSPPSADFLALHYACGAPAATSETVTITLGAAVNYGAILVESWSGVAISSCYVASSYGWSSAGLGGKVSYSATSGQMVYAMTDQGSATAGSGFTLLQAPANEPTDEYLVAASTTSGNATFSSVQTIQAAVFAAAPASAPCVPTLALLGVGGSCG